MASDSRPTNVVGHSLGGAVALQLQKDKPELMTRTYGAPVLDPLGLNPGDRYRSYGDPISMLDRGAKSSLDPPSISISGFHGYDTTAGRRTSSGDATVAPSGEAIISE
jgi:pimeloyl-ACP methyl ester carboxylesterase